MTSPETRARWPGWGGPRGRQAAGGQQGRQPSGPQSLWPALDEVRHEAGGMDRCRVLREWIGGFSCAGQMTRLVEGPWLMEGH